MTTVRWERYPQVVRVPLAKAWLSFKANLGLSSNTIDAYGRAVDDYLRFSDERAVDWLKATREHVAHYVQALSVRPNPKAKLKYPLSAGIGLANATLLQRVTAVRLLYDYIMEEALRLDNPVGRGRYTPGHSFGGHRERSLLPTYHKLPWIPTDEQWQIILKTARNEPIRNRLMLALSYDAALRREELCSLATGDVDPAQRLLRIRAETTKNRQERVVPYSLPTSRLFEAYLAERRTISRSRGPLFLSESRRNRATPISIWTWSKVVQRLATTSGVSALTTHTPRHLCLTDLARADWDIHQIALFAGHRSVQTTLLYIHLSGRDLKEKIEKGMAAIHQWRVRMTGDLLL